MQLRMKSNASAAGGGAGGGGDGAGAGGEAGGPGGGEAPAASPAAAAAPGAVLSGGGVAGGGEMSVVPFMFLARYGPCPRNIPFTYSENFWLVSGSASCGCSAISNSALSTQAKAHTGCTEDELAILNECSLTEMF
jgi:hypothetical protein